MPKPKPVNNPEYTTLFLLILGGKNTPKQLLNHKKTIIDSNDKKKKVIIKTYNQANLSMKLQYLKRIKFIENDRFRSINNSSTSKYYVNWEGILIYIFDEVLFPTHLTYLDAIKEVQEEEMGNGFDSIFDCCYNTSYLAQIYTKENIQKLQKSKAIQRILQEFFENTNRWYDSDTPAELANLLKGIITKIGLKFPSHEVQEAINWMSDPESNLSSEKRTHFILFSAICWLYVKDTLSKEYDFLAENIFDKRISKIIQEL